MLAVNHIGFIMAAYASVFAIVGVLIAWVMIDFRAQRRKLADLEMHGVVRRSSAAVAQATMEQAKEKA